MIRLYLQERRELSGILIQFLSILKPVQHGAIAAGPVRHGITRMTRPQSIMPQQVRLPAGLRVMAVIAGTPPPIFAVTNAGTRSFRAGSNVIMAGVLTAQTILGVTVIASLIIKPGPALRLLHV